MKRKKSSFAGMFYPNTQEDIVKMIEYFNTIDSNSIGCQDIKAMIVPHAGYIYSGYSANLAYKRLSTQDIKTVVVIGPSHRVYFDGVSVAKYDVYETPFGDLSVDDTLIKGLESSLDIGFYPKAHQEHSTEVQMPFIKYYMPEVNVVELVYANIDAKRLSEIISFCMQESIAVVISSDLSHFYDIDKANRLDSICIKAIDDLDVDMLNQGCEACGKLGIEALLIYAKKVDLKSHILDYRTSADVTKDTKEVVGYLSALFCKE